MARLTVTVGVLAERLHAMRRLATDLDSMKPGGSPNPPADQVDAPLKASAADGHGASLVDRALVYLESHYQTSSLSLTDVAAALNCNPRYLTTRFTEVVGEHMRVHLRTLRVVHACRLLIDTDLHVREIARASGFNSTNRCTTTFRQHVGVAPLEYRRIFSRTI